MAVSLHTLLCSACRSERQNLSASDRRENLAPELTEVSMHVLLAIYVTFAAKFLVSAA